MNRTRRMGSDSALGAGGNLRERIRQEVGGEGRPAGRWQRWRRKAQIRLLPTLILVAVVCLPWGASAQIEGVRPETLRLAGLDRPVEILKDRWGIAHIYAETEHDLFFAQGWNAARDRLFQLELWRRIECHAVGGMVISESYGNRHGRKRRDYRIR